MNKRNNTFLRPAIAMIELIFALVIMAIVLLSAPRLIHTATQSGFLSMQQEGINEAASKVSLIMSYPWDEANTDSSFLSPILYVSNSADSSLREFNSSGRRAGTPKLSTRSFIRTDGNKLNASAAPLGFDTGENNDNDIDDMDDFADTAIADSSLQFIDSNENNVDYIENNTTINIHTAISYMNDTPAGGTYVDPGADGKITFSPLFDAAAPGYTTNIKKIIVTLTSTSTASELNNKKIVLKAFTCNIGNYSFERDF
ncbi:MAG: hypothetical protein P794_01240 [Epsilonproteobacteria bacterium (ex Lamellibrachia satsuma)]|nr:MAG: hypothetical protein P794_01240 [Epsilonproteobacteria bacterium (ex Lamellibrachia satsuma)]